MVAGRAKWPRLGAGATPRTCALSDADPNQERVANLITVLRRLMRKTLAEWTDDEIIASTKSVTVIKNMLRRR
jgi:hypothetical protein